MKDLYTFDYSSTLALETYHRVREAYARLFDELKLPYLVAEADSGDMGGNLSHEFHFPTSMGEDHIISCSNCDYVANEELVETLTPVTSNHTGCIAPLDTIRVWRGISRDRLTLVNVWYPSLGTNQETSSDAPGVNLHAVKSILPELDPSVDDPFSFLANHISLPSENKETAPPSLSPQRILNLVDYRLSESVRTNIESRDYDLRVWLATVDQLPANIDVETIYLHPSTQQPLNLLRIRNGDPCPRCSNGELNVQKAIELGHTFHLGTRYSDPLSANIMVPDEILRSESTEGSVVRQDKSRLVHQVPMQMGCYGIGVSRMIGAVADTLADDKGLNWPRVMAPFDLVIVPSKGRNKDALEVYDELCTAPMATGDSGIDLVLDDREVSFPWKMRDADLAGFPIIIVVGRRWEAEKMCEVQCRRLEVRQELHIGELQNFVMSLLVQL
jgi:prolyl-tRNA synthetase